MSDLSMYEFGDIAWDEFCISDDHTVPLSGGIEQENEHPLWDNARGISAVDEIEPEKPPFVNTRKRKSGTKPLPQTSDCVFNSCNEDSALSQQESDVTFFDETRDMKNSGDLFIYYGWPDIGNLEEVEQIFSNEDEFRWFVSPESIEASFDGSKPELKFTYSDSSPLEESNSNCCEHLRNETHSSMGMDKTQPNLDRVSEEASKGAASEVLSCKGIKKEKQPNQFDNNVINPLLSYQTTPIVPNEKEKVQHSANKFNIIGDSEQVPIEMGPSNLRESSISSTLDDTSLEATSFRQLQLVMEQLDLRMKLCIRDSLYRLARSAAQRHNNDADLDIGSSQNKYSGFMDTETDTNTLDRSVAHLLFHRPSAQSTTDSQEHCLHNSAT